tara:strand:- start:3255 stop:3995 length:741 start_codon:yes stop_codon:yes gene_type:complete
MFKKLMASVGIGNATVDTIVKTENIYPDSMVDLEIVIKGGSVEQDLSGLSIALCTAVKQEVESGDIEFDYNSTYIISQFEVPMEHTLIQPEEEMVIECQIHIHPETPITALRSQSAVWLRTGLDIDNGLDASDKDYLVIQMPKLQETILSALSELGYSLVKIDTEQGHLRGADFQASIGCYQEFEFKSNGFFSDKEVEVSFVQFDDSLGVVLEIDRRFGGDSYRSALIPLGANYDEVLFWLKDNIA